MPGTSQPQLAAERWREFQEMMRSLPEDDPVPLYQVPPGEVLRYMTAVPVPGSDKERHVYAAPPAVDHELGIHVYPQREAPSPRPGVLFVHGGGWVSGFPEMQLRQASLLARVGYVTAMVEYRLAGIAKWPAQIEDVRASLRWLGANAQSLGLDAGRIAVAGQSAGGHLAAMAALTGSPGTPAARAALLWCPVTDLRPENCTPQVAEVISHLLGIESGPSAGRLPASLLADASPIDHVAGNSPPVLTLAGAADSLVALRTLRRFHEALDRHGVPNRLEVFEGRDHGVDFARADFERSFRTVTAFLDEHLPLHPARPVEHQPPP